MCDSRQAHPAYSLDVDEMILDYLLFKATESCLEAVQRGGDAERKGKGEAEGLLMGFDGKRNHPGRRLQERILEGVELLKLVALLGVRCGWISGTLFCGSGPGSSELRKCLDSCGRAAPALEEQWAQDVRGEREKCLQAILEDRASQKKPAPPADRFDASFVDMLDPFISLSAQRAAQLTMEARVSRMLLVAELMLHAALEHYEHFKPQSLDDLDTIFSCRWTPSPEADSSKPSAEAERSNGILAEDDSLDEDLSGDLIWSNIIQQYKAVFLAVENRSWRAHIRTVREHFPTDHFVQKLLEHLTDVFEHRGHVAPPVLVQLERGHLKNLGMTQKQTAELMRRAFIA
ncbi:MAG: hypothetical protein Q9227_001926 [Pyrenula ochraceoflavens]